MFKNEETYATSNQTAGLAYDATIEDLIDKDTDGDTIPDWQESLYGLDPTTKETVPGTPDVTTMNKLRADQNLNDVTKSEDGQIVENLTETEKFSRELFSTAVSLNQNGDVSQATADEIGGSLADKLKNSAPRKVFSPSDIKIDSTQNTKNYTDSLINFFEKNKIPYYAAMDVLQKFIIDENNVDASALTDLDPIIKNMKQIIDTLAKISVPETFVSVHIDYLNAVERIMENLSDIRLYDTDPIIALAGISQYENNYNSFMSAEKNLLDIINRK